MIKTLTLVFLLSTTPIGELRIGIPYGILHNINPYLTFTAAITGNAIPILLLIYILPKIENRMQIWVDQYQNQAKIQSNKLQNIYFKIKSIFFKIYIWYKNHTKKKYSKTFLKIGALALTLFVAIPMPITGVWTGTLAAHIFNVPKKYSIPSIAAGMIISGIIVSFITINLY